MKIVEQSATAIAWPATDDVYALLELAGRTAWKSEGKKPEEFLSMIIKKGHESVLEHVCLTVRLITSRTVSHALVRHRAGMAYTQESSQFCNYSLEKFGTEITFAKPVLTDIPMAIWAQACEAAEEAYFNILKLGKPQDARTVLPGSVKTELIMTGNIRAWRHILKIRAVENGDAIETRQLMQKVLALMNAKYPVLFYDLCRL